MKKVTIKDIAKELNISIATVSRALNDSGYISAEVKSQVLKLAKELNYIPNKIAKNLKSNRTNMIGIVVPDISNEYYLTAAKGIEDTLLSDELTLLFSSSNENPSDEKKILNVMFEQRVDAVVLATSGLNAEDLNFASANNMKVILFDRRIDNVDFNVVVEDNYLNSYNLAKDVIERGHQKIAILAGLQNVSTGHERLDGIKYCLIDHDIDLKDEYLFIGDFGKETGEAAADYFLELEDPPTAIISCNNHMTLGMVSRLYKHDRANLRKFFIASYGSIELDTFFDNEFYISTVQDPYKMGVAVGNLLNQILSGKQEKPKEIIFLRKKCKIIFK